MNHTDAFHRLHASGCFVIPNPWDVGSARALAGMGFPALATTSSGFAWSTGRGDNDTVCEDALAHARAIASGVDVPVNLDFQDCFADDAAQVFDHVCAAVETGVAGLSIEDSPRDRTPDAPLLDFDAAVERVRAARRAIDESGSRVLLTARTEGFIVGRPDLDETVRRLTAFADVGADCLYAPGLRTTDHIATVVEAVLPKPVNVLVGSGFTTVQALAALGVRRISVGGALARAAWTGFLAAAREIADDGTFTHLDSAVSFGELERRLQNPA
jgi:methylisocitrate lyase